MVVNVCQQIPKTYISLKDQAYIQQIMIMMNIFIHAFGRQRVLHCIEGVILSACAFRTHYLAAV